MPRLLYIAHRLPYPPDKGERLRAYHQIRALADEYEITLLALLHHPDEARHKAGLEPFCRRIVTSPAGGRMGLVRGALGFAAGRSVTQGYFRSPALLRAVKDTCRDGAFDVVFGYCSSVLPYVLAADAHRRVLDLVDVDSLKWASYAERAPWPKSLLYREEARRVAALERRAVQTCDAVLRVSPAEVDAFHARADTVYAAPNGVDTDYFRPMGEPVSPPRVVFTGTMDYRPNVEGVGWFVHEVWPKVRAAIPNAGFDIVGRDPAPEVRRLHGRDGIHVTGTVPDVRPYIAAATLAVAPLFTARGIQNKILEALAMALPVVATPQALEGIDAGPDAGVTAAACPDEWVARSLALLQNAAPAAEAGRAGRRFACAAFSWKGRLNDLKALIGGYRPSSASAATAAASLACPPNRCQEVPS